MKKAVHHGIADGINLPSHVEMCVLHNYSRQAALIFLFDPLKAAECREGMPVSLTVSVGAMGTE